MKQTILSEITYTQSLKAEAGNYFCSLLQAGCHLWHLASLVKERWLFDEADKLSEITYTQSLKAEAGNCFCSLLQAGNVFPANMPKINVKKKMDKL